MLPVSVVIPSTGREQLATAVNSVLSQTMVPTEIIVCIDGPILHDSQINQHIEHFQNNNVKVIELPENSGGPAKPRNVAVALASQPYVAFLDDDDSWLPEKLEVQIDYLNSHPECIAVGSNALLIQNTAVLGTYFGSYTHRATLSDFITHNPMITSSVICKREAVTAVGGFNEHVAYSGIEDYLLWARLACIGRIHNLPSALVKYRVVGEDSLSTQVSRANVVPSKLVIQDLKSWSLLTRRTIPRIYFTLILSFLQKIVLRLTGK